MSRQSRSARRSRSSRLGRPASWGEGCALATSSSPAFSPLSTRAKCRLSHHMMSAIEARHAKMPAYRDGDLPAGVADFFVPGDPEEAQLTDIVGLVGVNKLLLT